MCIITPYYQWFESNVFSIFINFVFDGRHFWKFLTCENSCVTTSGNQAKQPVEPWKRRKMAVWVLFFFWPFCFAEEILLLDVVDNGNWSTFSDVDTLLAI